MPETSYEREVRLKRQQIADREATGARDRFRSRLGSSGSAQGTQNQAMAEAMARQRVMDMRPGQILMDGRTPQDINLPLVSNGGLRGPQDVTPLLAKKRRK